MKISSRERLLGLPEVFTKRELMLAAGLTPAHASQAVWRWTRSEQIVALGGKSDVYINLVRAPGLQGDGTGPAAPKPSEELWQKALLRALPSALFGGQQVLAEAGVTTQFTHLRDVLISSTESRFDIEGVVLHPRPVGWLRELGASGAISHRAPGLAVPSLRPGAALADLDAFGAGGAALDDIERSELALDERELHQRLLPAAMAWRANFERKRAAGVKSQRGQRPTF